MGTDYANFFAGHMQLLGSVDLGMLEKQVPRWDSRILSATGADNPDSHRPTGARAVWSFCGPRSSSSRTVGHCGSDILGRSSSPPFQRESGAGYHWIKRMGLARSLVLKRRVGNSRSASGVSGASRHRRQGSDSCSLDRRWQCVPIRRGDAHRVVARIAGSTSPITRQLEYSSCDEPNILSAGSTGKWRSDCEGGRND